MTIPPLLDATHAAFIQRGVAIAPVVARWRRRPGSGACVRLPRLARPAAGQDLRARSRGAGAPCRGARDERRRRGVLRTGDRSHDSVRRATDASVVPMTATDSARLPAYADAMVAQMALCGFSEAYARTAWGMSPGELVAVTFTPVAAFVQTPGPRAGAPLAR